MRSLLLLIVGFLAAGCSPLHTAVAPDFDWSTVATVVLEEPEHDPWGLLPVVREQMRQIGEVVPPSEKARADLRVRFFVVDARDLNEAGQVFFRPKSLHLQLFAAEDPSPVATGDYFLSASESPERAVRALFASLRNKRTSVPEASTPDPQPPAAAATTSSKPTDKAEDQLPASHPEPRSSWSPRLKSWGVEEWGTSRNDLD